MKLSGGHGTRWSPAVGGPDPPKLYSSRPSLVLSLLEYRFAKNYFGTATLKPLMMASISGASSAALSA
jgi:hypothetical protein